MPTVKPAGSIIRTTNIRGIVFHDIDPKDFERKKVTLESLLDPQVVEHIKSIDSPASRHFKDFILDRQIKPGDVVIPELTPHPGITHVRDALIKPTNTGNVFRGARWAGGVLGGNWSSVYGQWRIPVISRPPYPAGNGNRWKSSSWVGLDGSTTNDVLQAGIRQDLLNTGEATCEAWFEWFSAGPDGKPPDGSPDYVYETAFKHFEVAPGHEVFASISYRGGQGHILFANISTDKIVSQTLPPPPLVKSVGSTAEWIMEDPDYGEPDNALVAFSPVIFTNASAYGPDPGGKAIMGDPLSGDTNDIDDKNGVTLTSVQLSTFKVVVSFIGPDWPTKAMEAFRQRCTLASNEGLVAAFPNFYEADYGPDHVGGTIFVDNSIAEWRDVFLTQLGNPSLENFWLRLQLANAYAAGNGFVGGFPTYFHADYGKGIVCGTVCLKAPSAEFRDVPLAELGHPDLADPLQRFRSTQDYATKNGFVGGFPTLNHADYGAGIVCGTVLLRGPGAQWRDVLLYKK